jgi:hypothetical protein
MRPHSALLLLVLAAGPMAAQPARPRTVALPAPNATLAAEFTLVSGVRELADGRLLVADQREKTLLVADWKAGTTAQIGRNGSGPGEYVQPTVIFALGADSSLLPDVPNGRWLLLDGARVVSTVAPNDPAIAAGARRPLGADGRGRVAFTRSIDPAAAAAGQPRIDSLRLIAVARADGREDTLTTLLARKARINVQGPRDAPTSVDIVTHPLAAPEQPALFADGWVAIARVAPYRVDWIAPDERVTRGKALPFEAVKLDDREKQVFVERLAERTGRPRRAPDSFMDWPEVMPPFINEAVRAAPDGLLWILRSQTAAVEHPPYDVIDRKGDLVARVTMEKGVHVAGFGRGVIYTVATDEDGLQRLQRRPMPRLR